MKFFLFSSLILLTLFSVGFFYLNQNKNQQVLSVKSEPSYWLVLKRKSNIEHLYFGSAGDEGKSKLIKIFNVKSGMPGESPTPLPQILGRKYWLITEKMESSDNPETAPYFLTLDVPVSEQEPFGPTPYLECNGQCNWKLPGYFGLHGVNGDINRLSNENQGSSGCIRHKDEDITFLYNILDPKNEEIRYYIDDV